MGKLLGIDYGVKKIGLAETDELQIISAPLDTVETKNIWEYLDKFLAQFKIEKFIVGLPTYSDGSHSETTKKVLKFSKELSKKYPSIPLIHVDESYSSQRAFQTILDSKVSKKKRRDKTLVDKISASIILQTYMEEN